MKRIGLFDLVQKKKEAPNVKKIIKKTKQLIKLEKKKKMLSGDSKAIAKINAEITSLKKERSSDIDKIKNMRIDVIKIKPSRKIDKGIINGK